MLNLNLITLLLVIIGGLNIGLVGVLELNLLSAILGDGVVINVVNVLIGLSAIYQLLPVLKNLGGGESVA